MSVDPAIPSTAESPVVASPAPVPNASAKQVLKHARVIGFITFLSRVLGLIRERMLTQTFGDSPILAAFRYAFAMPNLFRKLLGEGALSAAFVPLYTRAVRGKDPDGTPHDDFAAAAVALQVLALIGITVIGEIILVATLFLAHLRPETAQGMFVNFTNVMNASRKRPPFGIAQTGKSFRNEITPGQFVFRTREFEQMEMEFFVPPAEADTWYEYWCNERFNWYLELGIPASELRLRPHDPDELSHYSLGTSDVEYRFPWGWDELEGIANRGEYDLKAHATASGEKLDYFDQSTNERYTPYVIEPAAGATRTMMAFLLAAYDEEEVRGETRTVLRLHPRLAPYKVAVLPLSKKPELSGVATEVLELVQPKWMVDYDETQAIGRRYRRQDELGTPYCVTVDFDTLEDRAVTVRDRDSMDQVRVPIADLVAHLDARLAL